MGTTTETPLLTFEQFERMPEPDQPGKQELVEGELIEVPPPGSKHNRRATKIFQALTAALAAAHARGEAAELGEVFIEMGYKLGIRNWLQPDISISHPGQSERKYLEGAPAIAIEVVSPDDRAADLDRKTDLYFKHGAREVWRLYQSTRRMMIHSGSASQVRVEHEAVTTPLLPGFSLTLREILRIKAGHTATSPVPEADPGLAPE
jgi:Uma2 family endonuclease